MMYQEEARFSDAELEKIASEGLIYMCACPAQVAEAVRTLRELYRYQLACLKSPENDGRVHQAISEAAIATHEQLQDCMEKILMIEGWDRTTLEMPANLRVKQMMVIDDD